MKEEAFSLTCSSEETEISFVPTDIKPLGIDEIAGGRANGDYRVNMRMKASKYVKDGIEIFGQHIFDMPINFEHAPLPYALVENGWLPMPFSRSKVFLVDRNVVITLDKIKNNKFGLQNNSVDFWIKKMFEYNNVYNPILYAYESGYRRKPSYEEFVQAFKDGTSHIKDVISGATVIQTGKEFFDIAYKQLCDLDERYSRESEFLKSTINCVSQRVSRTKENKVLEEIIQQADRLGISRFSLCVLCVISMLYENIDGNPISIGRDVIKKIKDDGDVFNVISDIRNIEIAASMNSLTENSLSFCTCDDGVAKLWCALNPRAKFNEHGVVDFTVTLSSKLFNRLCTDEVLELRKILASV